MEDVLLLNKLQYIFGNALNSLWKDPCTSQDGDIGPGATPDFQQSLKFFGKLLPAFRLFPPVYSQLWEELCDNYLPYAIAILHRPQSEIDVDSLDRLRPILDFIAGENGDKIHTRRDTRHLFSLLVKLILTEPSLDKSTFIKCLQTCRKLLQDDDPTFSDSEFVDDAFKILLKTTVANKQFFEDDQYAQKAVIYLRFLLQNSNVKFPPELGFLLESANSRIIGILVEFHPDILDSRRDVLEMTRGWLKSKDSRELKDASCILKRVVNHLQKSKEKVEIEGILMKNSSGSGSGFLKFWGDYFDLFELLDEKQSHLILPLLDGRLKLFKIEGDLDKKELCQWWLIIKAKMMSHENREIAKVGFKRFLNMAAEFIQKDPSTREILEDFFISSVLPLIREEIGWILPHAEEYFSTIVSCGQLIAPLFQHNSTRIIKTLLGFITQDGIPPGPASALFIVESMAEGLRLINSRELKEEFTTEDLCAYLHHFGLLITKGLTPVDPFLRRRIERTLLEITIRIYLPHFPVLDVISTEFQHLILSLIGGLSLEIIFNKDIIKMITSDGVDVYCTDKDKFKELLRTNVSKGENLQLHSLNLKGDCRMQWIGKLYFATANITVTLDEVLPISLWLVECSQDSRSVSVWIETCEYFCRRKSFRKCSSIDTNAQFQADPKYKPFHDAFSSFSGAIFDAPLNLTTEEAWKILEILEVFETQLNLKSFRSFITNVYDSLKIHGYASIRDVLKSPSLCIVKEFIVWKLLRICHTLEIEFPKEDFQLYADLFMKPEWIANKSFNEYDGEVIMSKYKGIFKEDFLCAFHQLKMDAFGKMLGGCGPRDLKFYNGIVGVVMDNVDKSGFGGVASATGCVTCVLKCARSLKEMEEFQEFGDRVKSYVELGWRLIFELRKSEMFSIALEEFSKLVAYLDVIDDKLLLKYAELIFAEGETIIGIPYSLIQAINKRFQNYEEIQLAIRYKSLDSICKICLWGSWSGPALPKNNRVPFSLWNHLVNTEDRDFYADETSFTKDAKTRLLSIKTLQLLLDKLKQNGNSEHTKFLHGLMELLLTEFNDGVRKKGVAKRYFQNSGLHRKKHRIAQTLLILFDFIKDDQEQTSTLFEDLMTSLAVESPQPSVRYLMEWIVIKILLLKEELWDKFFTISSESIESRIGFGSFFSSISFHVIKSFREFGERERSFCENSLKLLSELVIGHHATVRAYSQACFQKIFEILPSHNGYSEIKAKYEVIYISLKSGRTCGGNSAKLAAGLEYDFYLQHFHPVRHFTPQVIFVYLPKMAEVAADEIPLDSEELLSDIMSLKENDNSKEIRDLYLSHEKTWHLKTLQVSGREAGEDDSAIPVSFPVGSSSVGESTSINAGANYQKKLNPWKTLSVEESKLDQFSEGFLQKKKTVTGEEGLIVVASLLDKIPNLGGLCRSAEIFGVSKYVISSMKILDNQQFMNLSVTAQEWIDIEEVPEKELEIFLTTYAAKGYKILGIEQTQQSIRLHDYKFPKKSLLLLGNEKLGIPPHLLHLVDVCLEIPQVGVIRSLNVHVTGALSIWQYAQQHLVQ